MSSVFHSRFFWKLYAGYMALIVLTTTLVGIMVARRLVEESLQETQNMLQAHAILLRDIAAPMLGSPIDAGLQRRLHLLGTAISTRFTVIRADGTVAADSDEEPSHMDNHSNRAEIVAARVQGQPVVLTRTEFRILHLLARRPGWVFTRNQIIEVVQGEEMNVTARSVDVHIVSLRRKLGPCGAVIETMRGVGYRFRDAEE